MNRRDFLKLFRSLAVLPFIKPMLAVADNKQIESPIVTSHPLGLDAAQAEALARRFLFENTATAGQVVYIKADGKLDVWNGEGSPIGIAARDIAPGETVTFSIGGGIADVVSSG